MGSGCMCVVIVYDSCYMNNSSLRTGSALLRKDMVIPVVPVGSDPHLGRRLSEFLGSIPLKWPLQISPPSFPMPASLNTPHLHIQNGHMDKASKQLPVVEPGLKAKKQDGRPSIRRQRILGLSFSQLVPLLDLETNSSIQTIGSYTLFLFRVLLLVPLLLFLRYLRMGLKISLHSGDFSDTMYSYNLSKFFISLSTAGLIRLA